MACHTSLIFLQNIWWNIIVNLCSALQQFSSLRLNHYSHIAQGRSHGRYLVLAISVVVSASVRTVLDLDVVGDDNDDDDDDDDEEEEEEEEGGGRRRKEEEEEEGGGGGGRRRRKEEEEEEGGGGGRRRRRKEEEEEGGGGGGRRRRRRKEEEEEEEGGGGGGGRRRRRRRKEEEEEGGGGRRRRKEEEEEEGGGGGGRRRKEEEGGGGGGGAGRWQRRLRRDLDMNNKLHTCVYKLRFFAWWHCRALRSTEKQQLKPRKCHAATAFRGIARSIPGVSTTGRQKFATSKKTANSDLPKCGHDLTCISHVHWNCRYLSRLLSNLNINRVSVLKGKGCAVNWIPLRVA